MVFGQFRVAKHPPKLPSSSPDDISLKIKRASVRISKLIWKQANFDTALLSRNINRVRGFLDEFQASALESTASGTPCPFPLETDDIESTSPLLSSASPSEDDTSVREGGHADEEEQEVLGFDASPEMQQQQEWASETESSDRSTSSTSVSRSLSWGKGLGQPNAAGNSLPGEDHCTSDLNNLKDPGSSFAKQIVDAQSCGNGKSWVGDVDGWWHVLEQAYCRVRDAEWATLQRKWRQETILWDEWISTGGLHRKRRKRTPNKPRPLPTEEQWVDMGKKTLLKLSKNVVEMAEMFGKHGVARLQEYCQLMESSNGDRPQESKVVSEQALRWGSKTARQLLASYQEGMARRGKSSVERFHQIRSDAATYECHVALLAEFAQEESETRRKMVSLGFTPRAGADARTLCTGYVLHLQQGWPVADVLKKVKDFKDPRLIASHASWQTILTLGKGYSIFKRVFGKGGLALLPVDLSM